MRRIESLEDLKRLGDELKEKAEILSQKDHPRSIIQVRVAMATCGIASGARLVFEFMKEELEKRSIPARVTQTGCMTYCYAEPTVEIILPGKEPVMFGFVTVKKADEIIEKFIRKGELVDGVIPVTYETIESYSAEIN